MAALGCELGGNKSRDFRDAATRAAAACLRVPESQRPAWRPGVERPALGPIAGDRRLPTFAVSVVCSLHETTTCCSSGGMVARAAALRPAQGAGRLGMGPRPQLAAAQLSARPAHGPRLPLRPRRAFQPPTATSSAAAATPGPASNGGSGQQQQKPAAEPPPPPPMSAVEEPPVQLTGALSRLGMSCRGGKGSLDGMMCAGRRGCTRTGPTALVRDGLAFVLLLDSGVHLPSRRSVSSLRLRLCRMPAQPLVLVLFAARGTPAKCMPAEQPWLNSRRSRMSPHHMRAPCVRHTDAFSGLLISGM